MAKSSPTCQKPKADAKPKPDNKADKPTRCNYVINGRRTFWVR